MDAWTSTCSVRAELEYLVGPTSGCPLFDLRQHIDRCWLDGLEAHPDLVSDRDVGAGAFSTVRMIDRVQTANSVHRLRLAYRLATPRAELGGDYPPVLHWSDGGRLRWSFGLADLYAGRHLEAWFPANLPFDQFPFRLDLRMTGTQVAHSVITNATLRATGDNRWTAEFPAWSTTMSSLVELRPSDSMERAAASVLLPVSGRTISIEMWQERGGSERLPAQLKRTERLLASNERDYGAFDGDRFVCLLHGAAGGMEYANATTTSADALEHEIFHSWFARGITPASHADGWWDEAFTRFHDDGAMATEPFDFAEPPMELCSRASFQRRTAANAYSDGARFFRGVAAAIGAGRLRAVMSDLYRIRNRLPLSTASLEAYLVAASGDPLLVDAFHRFVYGFADPPSLPEITFGDATGSLADTWIRRQNDGLDIHQVPSRHTRNWVYARVSNPRSAEICRHFLVLFTISPTTLATPSGTRYLAGIAAAPGFDLRPGETRIVSAEWQAGAGASSAPQMLAATLHARAGRPKVAIRAIGDRRVQSSGRPAP
jgi:hypothetical protein